MHRKKQEERKQPVRGKFPAKSKHLYHQPQPVPVCYNQLPTTSSLQEALPHHSASCAVEFLHFQIALHLVAAAAFRVSWAPPPTTPASCLRAANPDLTTPLWWAEQCLQFQTFSGNSQGLFVEKYFGLCFRFSVCVSVLFVSKFQHHILLVLHIYSIWKTNQHLVVIPTRVSVQYIFITPKCNSFFNISSIDILRQYHAHFYKLIISTTVLCPTNQKLKTIMEQKPAFNLQYKLYITSRSLESRL